MMMISETTLPDAALPVAAFKQHLRLGSGFGQDTVQEPVLASFLRAAMAAIEARTGKVLIRRSFGWSFNTWRDCAALDLPLSPIHAVTQVAQVASDGTPTVVNASQYWLERDAQQPRLKPTRGNLPNIPAHGSVQVTFDAGMAVAWAGLPADLQQAVLMLAAHYYEYRNDTSLTGGCMPFGVTSLIERFRKIRLGGGVAR